MTTDEEWNKFRTDYHKFIDLVEDFKGIEAKFRTILKQRNFEPFSNAEVINDDHIISTLYSAISILNKQFLRSILYEKHLHEFSYKLMLTMSGLILDIQTFLYHPELDTNSLQNYYNCISKIDNLGAEIQGKYVDYLALYTLKTSNKREIIKALAAEVQLLKLAQKDK